MFSTHIADRHWFISPRVKTIDYVLTGTLKNSCFFLSFSIRFRQRPIRLSPSPPPSFLSVYMHCMSPIILFFFYHHVRLNSSQLWQKATGFYVLCVRICCRSFLYAVSRSGTPKFRGQINSCQEGLIPGERQRSRQREGEQEVRN